MPDFITLTCLSCGGKLQITNDIDRFACAFCGTEHIVQRGGGVISLGPVVEGLKKVEIGLDKTESEMALKRLEEEIAGIEVKINSTRTKGYPNSFLQVLAILMALIGGIVALSTLGASTNTSESSESILCFGAALLLIAIGILVAAYQDSKDFEKKKRIELETWLTLWGQKQAELKYHQDLVDRILFH